MKKFLLLIFVLVYSPTLALSCNETNLINKFHQFWSPIKLHLTFDSHKIFFGNDLISVKKLDYQFNLKQLRLANDREVLLQHLFFKPHGTFHCLNYPQVQSYSKSSKYIYYIIPVEDLKHFNFNQEAEHLAHDEIKTEYLNVVVYPYKAIQDRLIFLILVSAFCLTVVVFISYSKHIK